LELYEFQKEDVEKIHKTGHGLIGSEMGTGKTLEAIKLDESWYDSRKPRPTLIIAPLNTFDGWRDKYGILSPESDVTTIDRKDRDAFENAIRRRRGDVFLMHWDALRLMPNLQGFQFGTIVADECHRAANRKSQTTAALFKLHGNHRVAMSGTASGNNPLNLWSTLHWLWPTYYRSYWKFRNHYAIEGMGTNKETGKSYRQVIGLKNLQFLREEMDPWYIRHLKREMCCAHHPNGVMSWLPEKTYDKMWVDLSPTQRRIYNQMRDQMVAWVGAHENEPLVAGVAVAQLARLSQMALATPRIDTQMVWKKIPVSPRWPQGGRVQVEVQVVNLELPSSKMEALYELVKDNSDKKFVVYSSSKKMCYLTQKWMADHGVSSFVLSGDTPQAQREGMVDRFCNGNVQLFIGVIEAAAEGIDGLQYATDTAIFLDRSWRTVKNQQAEDRLHRGGQEDTVQIIDIMARDTIDMGRHTKLIENWKWIKMILGDGFNNQQNLEMVVQ
jgi:SNF2 family DNA or RNA helicase